MILEKCWQAGKLGHSGEKVISDLQEFAANVKHVQCQTPKPCNEGHGSTHQQIETQHMKKRGSSNIMLKVGLT